MDLNSTRSIWTTGKAYGITFNCLGTRAVHIDISPDFSTEKFLLVLRRFASIRGYPSKIYSDNGSQLVAASAELKKMVKYLDQKSLHEYGCVDGFQWDGVLFSRCTLEKRCLRSVDKINEKSHNGGYR